MKKFLKKWLKKLGDVDVSPNTWTGCLLLTLAIAVMMIPISFLLPYMMKGMLWLATHQTAHWFFIWAMGLVTGWILCRGITRNQKPVELEKQPESDYKYCLLCGLSHRTHYTYKPQPKSSPLTKSKKKGTI